MKNIYMHARNKLNKNKYMFNVFGIYRYTYVYNA